jgi:hypothetical protein
MAAKSTYTEAELKAYAETALAGLAATLSLTAINGKLDPVIDEALREYGVSAASEVDGLTEASLLLACVRLALWRHVTNLTNGNFAISDSGTSLSLSAINDQARASARDAQVDVDRLRSKLAGEEAGSGARFYSVLRRDDPLTRQHRHDDEFSRC